MKSPITGKKMTSFKERSILTYRKEEFPFIFHGYRCEDSKEQFTTTTLDEVNVGQVYNQYREKYNLPFPEEIKATRKKYGLSALKMSEVLGFGVNMYRNYENGEVPNLSNGKLIRLINDPKQFKTLVQLSTVLKEKAKHKLLQKIDALIEATANNETLPVAKLLKSEYFPGKISGYKSFDEAKLTEMVIYFAEHLKPWKTQLNKLLFYADFLMFSKHCISISGMRYRAINMGPVPQNYHSLFEYLANQNAIDVLTTAFANGALGEQFEPPINRKFDATIFEETELAVLQSVVNKFKSFNTKQLIDYSHKEKAWLENHEERSLISYDYAFSLKEF